MMSLRRCIRGLCERFAIGRSGAAAVEFAAIAPLILLILAGTADFGIVVIKQFRLNETLSRTANYALINNDGVSAAGAPMLSQQLAGLLAGGASQGWANSSVIVNNGSTATVQQGGTPTTGGTAALAEACYCPSVSGGAVTWGSPASCNAPCPGGGQAGRFVWLSASVNHQPIFINYGIVQAGSISTNVLVRAR